jgi:hypothetical protein
MRYTGRNAPIRKFNPRCNNFCHIEPHRITQYNVGMAEDGKKKHKSGRNRPGYIRPDPFRIYLYFTKAEFEAVTRRARQDGPSRHAALKRLVLDYAKS